MDSPGSPRLRCYWQISELGAIVARKFPNEETEVWVTSLRFSSISDLLSKNRVDAKKLGMPTRNTRLTTRHTKSSSQPDRRPRTQPVSPTAYSSESGRTYRLDRLIGRGGFGEVYLATPTPASGLPAQVCVKKDVRGLPCSDHLKEVIHRCLGSRGKRYEAASELIAALRQRPKEPRLGRVSSLAGKRLSFTGFLMRPRNEAIAAAKKAGAIVQSKPGKLTDVLVRGQPNAQQIAGKDAGSKLIEVRRLAAQGHKVTVIGERQYPMRVDHQAEAGLP